MTRRGARRFLGALRSVRRTGLPVPSLERVLALCVVLSLVAVLAAAGAAPLAASTGAQQIDQTGAPTPPAEPPVVPPDLTSAPSGAYLLKAALLAVPPTIDGVMDEATWNDAVPIDHFTQLETEEGKPATEPTEVRIGYDHENLYIGARCYDDEPDKIRATVMNRDGSLAYEDAVMVILDTFHDRQSGFLFMVNPLGAKYDATVRQEGEEINEDWDGLWRAAATRDDKGWTAEIAIPFRTLRFPREEVQTWGINVGRFVARKREEAYWKPMQRSYGFWARYKVSKFGEITGLEALERGSRYQIKPYILTGIRKRPGGSQETVAEPGLDLKTHLTSDLVADVTLNTDFAETEADQQQVNLTRFKLFYPEKREFFLEGADLFYFGERPEPYKDPETIFFFSRRIGLTEDGNREIPLLGGTKITGRVGDIGVGLLSAVTGEETYLATSGARIIQPQTTYSVLRLKRSIFGDSTIGFMGLDKDVGGDGTDNRGYGIDWELVQSENLKLGGFYARTDTPGLDGADWAGSSDLWWDSRRARVRLAYTEIGEDFNPELGFITWTGVKKFRSNLTRVFWPESPKVRQWFAVHYLDYVTDRDGSILSRLNNVEVSVLFADSSGLAFKAYDEREVLTEPFEIHPGVVIQPGEYDFQYGFFGFQTDYSKPVGGAGRLQFGKFYDGSLTRAFGAVVLTPRPGWLGVLIAEHTDVNLSAGDFTTDLVTADFQLSLSPRFTTLSKVQWNKDDNLRVRLILDWRYRPGSSLYLVYDETQDEIGRFDPHARPVPLNDRSLLLKLTYSLNP